MENCSNSQLLIDDTAYGYDLKKLLWKQQYHQPAYKEMIALTLKLLNIDFQHYEAKDLKTYFTENEIKLFYIL